VRLLDITMNTGVILICVHLYGNDDHINNIGGQRLKMSISITDPNEIRCDSRIMELVQDQVQSRTKTFATARRTSSSPIRDPKGLFEH
jgi:hypothetical protein